METNILPERLLDYPIADYLLPWICHSARGLGVNTTGQAVNRKLLLFGSHKLVLVGKYMLSRVGGCMPLLA